MRPHSALCTVPGRARWYARSVRPCCTAPQLAAAQTGQPTKVEGGVGGDDAARAPAAVGVVGGAHQVGALAHAHLRHALHRRPASQQWGRGSGNRPRAGWRGHGQALRAGPAGCYTVLCCAAATGHSGNPAQARTPTSSPPTSSQPRMTWPTPMVNTKGWPRSLRHSAGGRGATFSALCEQAAESCRHGAWSKYAGLCHPRRAGGGC